MYVCMYDSPMYVCMTLSPPLTSSKIESMLINLLIPPVGRVNGVDDRGGCCVVYNGRVYGLRQGVGQSKNLSTVPKLENMCKSIHFLQKAYRPLTRSNDSLSMRLNQEYKMFNMRSNRENTLE